MNILETGVHIFQNEGPKALLFFPGALFALIGFFILCNLVSTAMFGTIGVVIIGFLGAIFNQNFLDYWQGIYVIAFLVSIPYVYLYLKDCKI